MLKEDDLVTTLTELGYPLKKTAKYYQTAALYRGGNDNTSVVIYPEDDWVVDFVSGESFNIESFLLKALKLKDNTELLSWVELKKFALVDTKPDVKIKQPDRFSAKILEQLLPNHEYWQKRGVSLDTLKLFRGGLMLERCRLWNRYVFPIFNSKTEIVGLIVRDITGKSQQKYKIIGSKTRFVWPAFLNGKILKEKKEVVLVESPGDVVWLWENGIKNVLCLFGTRISSSIIKYLIALDIKKIYISTNNEPDNKGIGNNAALKIEEKLLQFFDREQVIIKLPPMKDWGDKFRNDFKRV